MAKTWIYDDLSRRVSDAHNAEPKSRRIKNRIQTNFYGIEEIERTKTKIKNAHRRLINELYERQRWLARSVEDDLKTIEQEGAQDE